MRLPLILAILIFLLFVAFSPRLPNYLFPSIRSQYLGRLLSSTKANSHLDSQKYWETREFYYPGVFYVYNDGLNDNNLKDFTQKTGLELKTDGTFPIFVYSSPKWHSYEALVNSNVLSDLVSLPQSLPIYQDSETQIYQLEGKTLIYFIKSYDELKTTNGFIYTNNEKLRDYRYWFGVSVITL